MNLPNPNVDTAATATRRVESGVGRVDARDLLDTGGRHDPAAGSDQPPEALQVRAVCKSYGTTAAVVDVDLAIHHGELLALVGPSGCGKSTLLRIVSGLIAADRGTITVGHAVVDDGHRRVEPERRDVGIVFQDHHLFPHLTIGDNITFGLRRLGRRQRAARRDHWLKMIELDGFADRYPHELSGGERQRVALARALAPEPTLMLLDEPFASLDPNLRAHLRDDVVELLRAAGTAAAVVTHDQAEALAIGDRVAVMHAGRLEQLAPPEDVYRQPASRFVAGFMGEADFLPGAGDGTCELGTVELAAAPGDAALLVVRPTEVTLGVAADDTPTGVITAAEFRGATRSFTVTLRSGATIRSTQPHHTHLVVGDHVGVTLSSGVHPVVPNR